MLLLTGCNLSPGAQASSQSPHTVRAAVKKQLIYVAIGASDTFGLGTDEPYAENWASDLAFELGPRYHLVNLGIPGAVAHSAMDLELPVALDAHPDLVTIWLGVNDIADNVPVSSYAHDIDLIISRLQAASPHVRIAIANIPDITSLPHFRSFAPQVLLARIFNYNAAISAIVQRHHVILVDLYQQSNKIKAHPEYISGDGFHPNKLGYLQLATFFYQVLQNAHAVG